MTEPNKIVSQAEREWWDDPFRERFVDWAGPVPIVGTDGKLEPAKKEPEQ